LALAYIAAMVLLVRPLLARLAGRTRVGLSQGLVAAILLLMLISSCITELIGIHALFGAFLFGAILPKHGTLASALSEKIEDVVIVLLLPLFFAFSGLRTQIGLLDSASSWWICGLIIVLACLGKYGGSTLAARITGFSWREASAIGILMNTRGLMELIVLNVGFDLGVISPKLFTMMVIMALVTTFMTTPLLERVYPLALFKAELSVPESTRRLVPQFTAVACVSEEASAPGLVTLAVALTGPTSPDARVYALRLVPSDERASPFIAASAEDVESDLRADVVLDAALTRGRALSSDIRPLSFVSTTPAKDIRDVAEVKRADIVLLGWQRFSIGTTTSSRSLLEEVVETTPCGVGVLVDRDLVVIKRVLVTFAGSHADEEALHIAARIALGAKASLDVLIIVPHDDRRLEETARRAVSAVDASRLTIETVIDAQPRRVVSTKSAEGYDLVVMSIGASWGVESHSLSLEPQRVIEAQGCSVLLVRAGSGSRVEEAEPNAPPSRASRFVSLRPPA
jgi:hypothetical protein